MSKQFQVTIVLEPNAEMTSEEVKELFDDLCFESSKIKTWGVKDVAGIEGEDAAGVDRRAEGADRESDVTGGWNQW